MFGFDSTPHRTFKKNFLKTIIFQISFEKNEIIDEKRKEIKELFRSRFPRQNDTKSEGLEISFNNTRSPQLTNLKGVDGIEMKSSDGEQAITVDDRSFSFTISGKAYKNYNGFKENFLKDILSFLEICQIGKIHRTAIRKINIVEFSLGQNQDASSILTLLINPDLIGNLNFIPNSSKIINNIQSLNYKDEDNFLNLKYGFNLPPRKEKIGQAIIDIDLYNQSALKGNEVLSKFDSINSEIFNIFSWVISDRTKELLNS